MSSFPRILLILSLVPVLAGAMMAQTPDGAAIAGKGEEKQPGAQPPTMPSEGFRQDDRETSALAGIGLFEVKINDAEIAQGTTDPQAMAAIVNPFSARKRGRIYGSLYEYHRNDNFDARNFFDPVGEPLPEFKRNQFGGSFGLFLSDKLNIFGTYDGLRTIKGQTLISRVPSPEMKTGDFSALTTQLLDPFTGAAFPGNRIPSHRFHPVVLKLLSRFPEPNRDDPFRNFANNQPFVKNDNTIGTRVDYEFSGKSKLFMNYSIIDGSEVKVNALPGLGSNLDRKNQNLSLSYNHTIKANLVSSIRLTADRNEEQELSNDFAQAGLLKSLGITGVNTTDSLEEGIPNFNITGYSSLAYLPGGSPRTSVRNDLRLAGNLTWVRKNHKLSFGTDVDVRQVNNNRSNGLQRGRFDFNGYYTGDGFADFLLGIPNMATRGLGSNRADLRQNRYRVFARDEWKISSKYTLSGALAYNYAPFFHSIHDNISIFHPLVFEPPLDGDIVVIGSDRAAQLGLSGLKKGQIVYPDRNDWDPEVGFAYSPLGNTRLVVRASYSINHDPIDLGRSLSYIGQNYPFYYVERAESSQSHPELNLSSPFTSVAPAERTIRAINPHMRNGFGQEWLLSMESEIFRNWNLEVRYSGWRGTLADGVIPANVPRPGEGLIKLRRPNPNYGRFDIFTDNSYFNGNNMRIQIRKRFSDYFSVQSEFSWARIFSDNNFGGDPSNPRDLKSERAVVSFRPDKMLSVNYILDLPIGRGRAVSMKWMGKLSALFDGWRISGITRYQPGRPFHPVLFWDGNNDGLFGDRPDRIGSGQLPSAERSTDRWFATEDFTAPAPYSFGNSGRHILVEPSEIVWDASIIRNLKLSDTGKQLEFRVQLFNAFNNVNFARPDNLFGTPLFGKISGAKDSREIEVALKFSF